jgi:hypothetical protein
MLFSPATASHAFNDTVVSAAARTLYLDNILPLEIQYSTGKPFDGTVVRLC